MVLYTDYGADGLDRRSRSTRSRGPKLYLRSSREPMSQVWPSRDLALVQTEEGLDLVRCLGQDLPLYGKIQTRSRSKTHTACYN